MMGPGTPRYAFRFRVRARSRGGVRATVGGAPHDAGRAPSRGTKDALRGCASVRACVVTDDVCVRVLCA